MIYSFNSTYKTLPILLIPLLSLFLYQAAKSTLATSQLDNAYYLLEQQNQTKQPFKDKNLIIKIQNALTTAGKLTPNNPEYHNLSANLKIWQTLITQTPDNHTMELAKKHYHLALKEQPNNPYLWSGLAKTDRASQKKLHSLKAMAQASHYAPNDISIQKQTVFWKLPIWNQLNHQQQKETINQLNILISNNKTRSQFKALLNKNNQKKIICSKLEKTTICKP